MLRHRRAILRSILRRGILSRGILRSRAMRRLHASQPPQQAQAAPAAYYDESDSEVEDEDGYDGHGPIEWAVKKWAMHKAKKQFQA